MPTPRSVRPLPRGFAGFRLGQSVSSIRASLKARGFRLGNVRRAARRGKGYLDLQAHKVEGLVRRVILKFHADRLVSVSALYHRNSYRRGRRLARYCAGHERTSRRRAKISCVDRDRRTGFVAQRNGRGAGVADIGRMIEVGLVSSDQIERDVERAQR